MGEGKSYLRETQEERLARRKGTRKLYFTVGYVGTGAFIMGWRVMFFYGCGFICVNSSCDRYLGKTCSVIECLSPLQNDECFSVPNLCALACMCAPCYNKTLN